MDIFYSCPLLGKEEHKPTSKIYVRVGKILHWSSELKVLHKDSLIGLLIAVRKNRCFRVKLNLLGILFRD